MKVSLLTINGLVPTYAYNSKTVWSSYIKFWLQFKVNKLVVCTKFPRNKSRDFDFKTQKLP